MDDGSMLLVSLVGSPAITNLANSQHSFNARWGDQFGSFQQIAGPNGYLDDVEDGFVDNADTKLEELGIANVGQTWNNTTMTVLSADFYRPPLEFDTQHGSSDTATYRRFDLGVTLSLNNQPAAVGGKPQGLMLTRPPLVLVHGIASGPDVWDSTNSGGISFDAAAQAAGYPTTFKVDHRGADPVDNSLLHSYGEGEISHYYLDVEQTIGTATQSYRSGNYFPTNPYATANSSNQLPAGALIADQKVDIVAHSYGGLLARWYVEQSPEYASRRDVRKLIELGTPNLGSPLANLVDEAYQNSVIANAATNVSSFLTIGKALAVLDARGKEGKSVAALVSRMPDSADPFPFYEDASVNSARLQTLNAAPFQPDVAYAAVVGTQSTFPGISGELANFQPYLAFEPMVGTNSYFPWLYQFDGTGATDAVVPTWSAALGVPAYNYYVSADHVDLVQNASVQQQVIKWLADPNVPLGGAQRALWKNQPPVNDRNAYQGATVDPTSGQVTGGGLTPNAIVGAGLPGTGLSPTTFGTSPAQVGAKSVTITGMIPASYMLSSSTVTVTLSAWDANHTSTLYSVTVAPSTAFTVDPAQLAGAAPTDWVAFTYSAPTLAVSRRHKDQLTGSAGTAAWVAPAQGVRYSIPQVSETSPATTVFLPDFVLPAPQVSGLNLTLSGAVEAQNPTTGNQSAQLDIMASGSFFNTTLYSFTRSFSPPTGTLWDGLLIPYSVQATLFVDSFGNVYGPDGNSGEAHPQVLQRLDERYGVPTVKSPTTQM